MQKFFCDWCEKESKVGHWTLKLCRGAALTAVGTVSFEVCPTCEEAAGLRKDGRGATLSEIVATLRERAKSPQPADGAAS